MDPRVAPTDLRGDSRHMVCNLLRVTLKLQVHLLRTNLGLCLAIPRSSRNNYHRPKR